MQLRRHHSPLPTCMTVQCLRFLHPFLPIPNPASIPSPATFFNIISISHAICDSRFFSEGKIFGLVADILHGRSQDPVVVSPTDWFVREKISVLSFLSVDWVPIFDLTYDRQEISPVVDESRNCLTGSFPQKRPIASILAWPNLIRARISSRSLAFNPTNFSLHDSSFPFHSNFGVSLPLSLKSYMTFSYLYT